MKKIALAALFLLGLVEMTFPFQMDILFYAYRPQVARVFDISKFTDEQQQLYRQFHADLNARSRIVFYFGVVTILTGILLIVADRRGKQEREGASAKSED